MYAFPVFILWAAAAVPGLVGLVLLVLCVVWFGSVRGACCVAAWRRPAVLVGLGDGGFFRRPGDASEQRKNKKTNFPNPIDFTTKMGYNINVVTHRKGQSTIMKANEIIGKAMEKEKVTQKALAEAMGLKSAQAVGNILYRENSVRANSFVKMLDIMGYEVIVRKKIGETEEWKVEA